MRFVMKDPDRKVRKLIYVGDDQEGMPLEVIAVELRSGELKIIHAMQLRKKFIGIYWEEKDGI